jgi:tetratricopeptide (TPR) repeat protein
MKEGYLYKAVRATMEAGDREAFRSIAERFEKLPKGEYSNFHPEFLLACEHLIEGRPADSEKVLGELRPKLEAAFQKKNRAAERRYYEPGWNYLMARARMAQGKEAEAVPLLEEMASPPNGWEGFEGRLTVYEAKAELAALLAKRGELERAEKLLEENKRWNPSWSPTRSAETTVAEVRRARVLASAK